MLDKFFLEDYSKRNNIPKNPRRYLAEYLQSEILSILYGSKYGKHLSFLGGTCLRFVYGIRRFSEDLDFDLIKAGLDYNALASHLEKKLKEKGFLVEAKTKKTENIFIVSIRFSEVMKQLGISDLADQKLKIKFEIDPKPYENIEYESKTIASYGKVFNVISNTLSTLFAQKIIALKLRPYQKGRDFYDIVWFLAQKNIVPNYAILKEKDIKTENREDVARELEKIISNLDLKQASKDVEKFLFNPEEAKWILNLPVFISDWARSEITG